MKFRLINGSGLKLAGWNENQTEKFLQNYMEKLCMNATIKDGAKEVINKLKEEGNRIIIITSRSGSHYVDPYDVSEKWLKKHGVQYDKLIVNGQDKANKCKENDIDIFIDDQEGFCKDIIKNTKVKVLMFDSPYNKNCNEYKKVYSWQQIYEEIGKKQV